MILDDQLSLFVQPDKINTLLTDRYRSLLRRATDIVVNPNMWDWHPAASRLYVIVDPTPEITIGGIEVPDSHDEQSGIGIIVAVGHAVGSASVPYPGSVCAMPADFLYRPTIFGAAMGKPLRLDWLVDSHYQATILVLCDRDLWATNWNVVTP